MTLPNSNTPLAWVTPELAKKLSQRSYASIWALAILSWDIAAHILDDYKLVTRYPINRGIIVYCISRLSSLAYILGLVVTTTTRIHNCNYIRYITFIYPLTLPFTLLLFVFRVSALYHNKKTLVALLSLTWLSVLGSSIALAVKVQGVSIAQTGYCYEDKPQLVASLATVLPAAHDTLIFWLTSWAFFMWHSLMDSENNRDKIKHGINMMVLGKHLPTFSRSILHDGQAYYGATLILTFCLIGMYSIQNPIITPCAIGILLFALINNMSCYVYRNMRFGFYRDDVITTSALHRALEGEVNTPSKQMEFRPGGDERTSTAEVEQEQEEDSSQAAKR